MIDRPIEELFYNGYEEPEWRVPPQKRNEWYPCSQPCPCPGHNPPGHMVIKECYIHRCPCCGKETILGPTCMYW